MALGLKTILQQIMQTTLDKYLEVLEALLVDARLHCSAAVQNIPPNQVFGA